MEPNDDKVKILLQKGFDLVSIQKSLTASGGNLLQATQLYYHYPIIKPEFPN